MAIVAGIDCGARTTKVVTLSTDEGILRIGPMLSNQGKPVESVATQAIAAALQANGTGSKVSCIVATGTMAPKLRLAHFHQREPQCIALAIAKLHPTVRTVIDIGAAKVLVVKCQEGVPLAVAYNERCASGAGVCLEIAAEVLGVPVAELGALALRAHETVPVQSTCAVFAESEIISLIHSGKKLEDIAKGVAASCASRIFPLLGSIAWEQDIAIVGGGAGNPGLVQALQELIGCPLVVPEHTRYYGAMGACLIASEQVKDG